MSVRASAAVIRPELESVVRFGREFVAHPAREADLDDIMEIEGFRWRDQVSPEAAASRALMADRIVICNSERPGYFWVVSNNGKVVGYFVLQPTMLLPGECVSWAHATDNGRLKATFDRNGPRIYGVSLGTADKPPRGTVEALAYAIQSIRLTTGKPELFACARMCGYDEAYKATGISAEDYWLARRGNRPVDPFLRLFETTLGLRPQRLLLNGYPEDPESHGHGVLVHSADPAPSRDRNERRLQTMRAILHMEEFSLMSKPNVPSSPHPGSLVVLEDVRAAAAAPAERIVPVVGSSASTFKPLTPITQPALFENLEDKLADLRLGQRTWYDVLSDGWVDMSTLGIPFGCHDWGEKGGLRHPKLCKFCALPSAALAYRQAYFGGRRLTPDEHYELFRENLAQVLQAQPRLFNLAAFTAGSFTAEEDNPIELQMRIASLVAQAARHSGIRRFTIESRAERCVERILRPLAEVLAESDVKLVVRVGVETQDDDLRLKGLGKGHTRDQLLAAIETMLNCNIVPGAYILQNPAPSLDPRWAVAEAEASLNWVLGELGFAESYFGPACVAPGTLLEQEWQAGRFRPSTPLEVWKVLSATIPKYGRRIHVLPWTDLPPLVAVPSFGERGIPEDLTGASPHDLAWHEFFAQYRRGTIDEKTFVASPPAVP